VRRKLLLIEVGIRKYKEPLLRALSNCENLDLYCASGFLEQIDHTWVRAYCRDVIAISYPKNSVSESVLEYCSSHQISFDGVCTWVEPAVPFANALQHVLKTPVVSAFNNGLIRNKRFVRDTVAKDPRVSQPLYAYVDDFKSIEAALGELRFPLVVKPAEFTGSLGVRIVRGVDEFKAAARRALEADFWDEDLRSIFLELDRGILCEELVPGRHFSVETVVQNGKPTVLGLTEKNVSDGLSFSASSHTFPAKGVTEAMMESISELITYSHQALRFENTFTNTDIRINGGPPILIEINPRIAGDAIAELLLLTWPKEVPQLMSSVPLGIPTPKPSALSFAGVRRSAVYISTTLEGQVDLIPDTKKSGFESYVEPGQFIYRNGLAETARLGHMIVPESEVSAVNRAAIAPTLREAIMTQSLAPHEWVMTFVARREEIPNLAKIGTVGTTRCTPVVLKERLESDIESFLIAYDLLSRKAVGFIAFTRLEHLDFTNLQTWKYYAAQRAENLSRFTARFIYVLDICLGATASEGTALALLKALLQHAHLNGTKYVATVARITGFGSWATSGPGSLEKYFEEIRSGAQEEPEFTVSKRAGGAPVCVVRQHFDFPDPLGAGVLFRHETF